MLNLVMSEQNMTYVNPKDFIEVSLIGQKRHLTVCGDFISDDFATPLVYTDQCDDGNLINGDGCSELCRIEPGF